MIPFKKSFFLFLGLCASYLFVHAQEGESSGAETDAPTMATPPSLPSDLKPPTGPPPGPPPQLPAQLRNRLPSNARGATVTGQAAGAQPGQDGTPPGRVQSPARESITQQEAPEPASLEVLQLTEESEGGDDNSLISQLPEPEQMVAKFVLKDDSALRVIEMIEALTEKPVLRMQNIPAAKINFDSQGPMTKQEMLIALESLLSLNGIAITELGDTFLKAVPIANAPQQVPIFITGSALALPPSQGYFTKLFQLNYLSTLEAQPVIQPLMSVNTGGSLIPFPKANSILITDALANLQRIEQVLQEADEPIEDPVEIKFFQLENVKARDLQARMQALTANQFSALYKYTVNNTIIEADERTNQIILMTHPSNVEMLSSIIEKLDINVEPNTTSQVFYIKHAKAVEIDSLLEEIVTGQQKVTEESGSTNRRPNQPNQPNQPVQITTGIDTSGLRFSEYITIVADERSNAIVVYGTSTDLKQIAKIIDEIDVLLAQVHIQVIIAEVKLTKNELDGISSLGLNYSAAEGFTGRATGPSFGQIPAPFDITWALDTSTITSTIRDSVTDGKATILSAPVIVTTHNQPGIVNVSERRPFITGSLTSGEGAGGAVTQTVDYRDVGIQLEVTPLIGSNGIVQMEIEQIVETIVPGQGVIINDVEQPFIDKREATSFISVLDNETIILAGLQQSEVGDTQGKLWLLGDIPLIGDWLFSNSRISDSRRELMLFITPRVIYSQEDATRGAKEAVDNLDNAEDVEYFMETRDISEVFERDVSEQPDVGIGSLLRRGPRSTRVSQ